MTRNTNPPTNESAPPDTTTGHPTHIPIKSGNIRQPSQLLHGPGITYCTAYLEDSSFDVFSYRLIGSCTANPKYDSGDMRRAILHALASSTETTTHLLVVMVLPIWEDTPWYSAAIRSHNNLETLIQIPAGHMRFVPAHKQANGDTTSLPPAKWRVESILKRGGQKQIR